MRAGVIIALVVVGGALVAAPVVAEYMLMAAHQAHVARLLEKPGTTSVNLQREEVGSGLQVGCWVTGTALAVAGIYLAVRHGREGAGAPSPGERGPA